MFSILIPTWNNIEFLKLCIQSIKKFSRYDHEILVYVNEGRDGTAQWLREQNIRFIQSEKNVGICLSLNMLAGLAKSDWLLYMNDDMYCCPDWDVGLIERLRRATDDKIFLSSLLIEPTPTGNQRVIVQDHGRSPHDFDEPSLLAHYRDEQRPDIIGNASQPTLVAKRWWLAVGGYSIEFSPGMSSDDDLLMKLWLVGFRHFEIIATSRLYHFACRSTGRVRRNRGSREFVLKWGITQGEFMRNYISLAADKSGDLHIPAPTVKGRLKRAAHGLVSAIPLGDFSSWIKDGEISRF